MSAKVIDGRAIAARSQAETATGVVRFRERHGRPPGLAMILVGNHPASQAYVANKRKQCEALGIRSIAADLPAETSQDLLLAALRRYNEDPDVDGILVQLPLPPHIDQETVIEAIDPTKDVDGFHPYNMGRLAVRLPRLRPCTPWGIMRLLAETDRAIKGADAVVIGASNIVGRPMALELLLAGATVTVCHRFSRDLAAHVAQADVLVAAAGKPGLVRGEWVREGAIVIDVGINRLADGRLVGDVDFEGASRRAAWITPVPGGVGPMTVAMLMANTLAAAEAREART